MFIKSGWNPLDFKSVKDLEQFPVLTKRKIVENQEMFISDTTRYEKAYPITTSGSTGDK